MNDTKHVEIDDDSVLGLLQEIDGNLVNLDNERTTYRVFDDGETVGIVFSRYDASGKARRWRSIRVSVHNLEELSNLIHANEFTDVVELFVAMARSGIPYSTTIL